MDILGLGFALLVILLFILAFHWTMSRQKEQSRRMLNRALELGFEPVDEGGNTLIERLVELHKKYGHQEIEVRNLYRRRGPDYQLYLFDLFAIRSDGPTLIQSGALAVLSPLLHLLRFSIGPKLETSSFMGFVGKLFYRLFRVILSTKRSLIRFETYPEFEKRYYVAGEDEEAVRKFLSDQILWRLSRERDWQIEAERDLFTFSKPEIDYFKKLRGDNHLKEQISKAMIVFDLFRER